MATYLSYVFTVQPNKLNSYDVSGPLEVKSVAAEHLEVQVADTGTAPFTEVRILRNRTDLGTSIVVSQKHELQFVNRNTIPHEGYFGALS